MLRLTTGQYNKLYRDTKDHTERNTRNRLAGKHFEDQLKKYHNDLYTMGYAKVYKTNPDIVPVSPTHARITGKGPCDYFAFLYTGQVVFFDAKSRKDKAFTLDDQHQIAWLRAMCAFGHRAGYMVYWSDYDQVCWHSIAGIDKRVRMTDGLPIDGVRWLDTLR